MIPRIKRALIHRTTRRGHPVRSLHNATDAHVTFHVKHDPKVGDTLDRCKRQNRLDVKRYADSQDIYSE